MSEVKILSRELNSALNFINDVKAGTYAELQDGINLDDREHNDVLYIEVEEPTYYFSFSC